MLEGKMDVLTDYLKFLQSNEEELLPGMLTILESAISHKYSIDSIQTDFENQLTAMGKYYETERNVRYFIDYIYLLAKYYSINGKYYDSINIILQSLTSCIRLEDDTGFRKSVVLFESLREHTNSDQLAEYQAIMLKILD
ncbi:hypothetical protein PWYN_20785 [Paenibacillus wynnii]|uniref:Transcriptional regulator n=1 Tax=Paenibacillus wynnii TaxID=268407 RepID=A0A098M6C4_9BACL|nr:hypothetical protein PWYN_20785 [Paenibacillus wynnii]